MNNIIQFLIGFRLPDIGYWNFLPRHFISLLYLGEIYRNLSEVTLKKGCGVCKWNTVSAVCNLYTIWSHLTRNETLHSSQNFCGLPHRISDTFPRLLNVARCVTRIWRQNFETFFSSPFIMTFKPLSMPHKLLQNDTMLFHPTFVPCILI
jgi:hypothetical protein